MKYQLGHPGSGGKRVRHCNHDVKRRGVTEKLEALPEQYEYPIPVRHNTAGYTLINQKHRAIASYQDLTEHATEANMYCMILTFLKCKKNVNTFPPGSVTN